MASLTLADLRSRVRRYIGDTSTDTTKQRWTNAIIDDAINDSMDEFASEALIKVDTATDTSVTGDNEYTFPTDSYKLKRVELDGRTIYPTAMAEMDMWKRTWREDQNGEPIGWYHTSGNNFKFYPPCESGYSGLTITYFYYDIPVALSSTTDTPDFASEYHKAVGHGAAAELLTNDRRFDDAAVHQTKFEVFKQKGRAARQRMHDRSGPMNMTIDRGGSGNASSDPLQRWFWGS